MSAPAGWPENVPPVPAQARRTKSGTDTVADMAYQRWRFSAAGLVSFTQFDGKGPGTVTKGPAAP